MIELIDQGLTVPQIAFSINVSPNSLRRSLKDFGIAIAKVSKKSTKVIEGYSYVTRSRNHTRERIGIDKDKVIQLLKEGNSLKSIAKIMGVHYNTMIIRANDWGLKAKELKPKKVKKERVKKERKPTLSKVRTRKSSTQLSGVTTNYWGEVQEQLVNDFLLVHDSVQKNLIYSKLRPGLLKLISGVVYKYCINHLKRRSAFEIRTILDECESFTIEKVLPKFNSNRARAYSFIGTSIRHYAYDIFQDEHKFSSRFAELPSHESGEGNEVVSALNNQFIIMNDIEIETYEELLDSVKDRINKLINEQNERETVLIALLMLLKGFVEFERNWGKHYLTYFLSTSLSMEPQLIRKYLTDLGIKHVIVCHGKSLDWFLKQEIIAKKAKLSAKEYFDLIDDDGSSEDDSKYKIQDKRLMNYGKRNKRRIEENSGTFKENTGKTKT